MQWGVASSGETSIDNLPNRTNGVFDIAYLLLRLLPSKDGVVLRRLIMTAVSAIQLDSFFFPNYLLNIKNTTFCFFW